MKSNVTGLIFQSKIMLYMISIGFLLYSVRPILSHYALGETLSFSFNLWFWFDPYQPGIYRIIYVCIVFVQFFITFLLLGCDLIFFSVAKLIEFCVKMIVHDVDSLRDENSSETDGKLVQIVKGYQKITEKSKDFEQIFCIGCLANIALSIFLICMLGFQIAVGCFKANLHRCQNYLYKASIYIYTYIFCVIVFRLQKST